MYCLCPYGKWLASPRRTSMSIEFDGGREVKMFGKGDRVMPSHADTLAKWNHDHRFQEEGNGFTFPFIVQSVRDVTLCGEEDHPQLVTINVPKGTKEVSGSLLTSAD